MKVQEPDLAGTYTYADYLTWLWDERVELIKGKIYKMSPPPTSMHQRVSMELGLQIGNYLKKKKCQVFVAPFDVRLPKSKKKGNQYIDSVVQPDLCVICDPAKIDEAGCLGAPDWIIEILSPYTSAKDLSKKFDLYENSKVKEYWVVHPVEATILVFSLNPKGKYVSRDKPYIRTDKLVSVTIPGLVIDLAEVFPETI